MAVCKTKTKAKAQPKAEVSKVVLKWRNKFSGEEGYVASVSKAKGYFINTFDKAEAKKYANETSVQKDLATLEAIGESENNDFFTETV